MDKPRAWLHGEHRNGYSVLMFGRVAIPASIFVGLYIAAAVITVLLLALSEPIFGVLIWQPAAWFYGVSGALLVLAFVILLIAIAIETIMDANAKEEPEESESE
ncbi:membrane protein [Microbacterium phage Big4]|nr:membrane protein [Microbacterium phage Big4]